MAETKQGLEVALYLIHRMALNHQSETLTLANSDGANANGVATQSTNALSPYPVSWYDIIVDRYVAGNTVPIFLQHMGNDVDAITGPDQFVYVPGTQKVHVSSYLAADTFKASFRDVNGGVWSLMEYKRSFGENENENVRPVHDWSGAVRHYKHGVFSAGVDFSMVLSDVYDKENMLLFNEDYGIVVEEHKAVADFTVHDATGVGFDVYVADLDLDCTEDDWSRLAIESTGVLKTKVASIVAIDDATKYFIDKAANKVYVGFVDLTPLDCLVTYKTDRTSASQEMICRLDYMAEDGSTVEFVTLFPKANVSEISSSTPDADDVMVSCKLVACGRPVTV